MTASNGGNGGNGGMVRVKANRNVFGLRAGQTAELKDSAYLRKSIEAGAVEIVEGGGDTPTPEPAKAPPTATPANEPAKGQ
jgi:hypothetical protein